MAFLRAVLDLRGLTSTEKLTLFALVLFSDGKPASYHSLTRLTGLARNTLRRTVPVLIGHGYLEVVEPLRRINGGYLPPHYRVRFERLTTTEQEART